MGAEMPTRLEYCAGIQADQDRLSCYDRLAASVGAATREGGGATAPQPPKPQPEAVARAPGSAADASILSRQWELEPATKRGIFSFRPHLDNYLVATYNSSPNSAPYRPFRRVEPGVDLSKTELAYQLGFKLKLAETPFDSPVDLWFAYTQRSFWQAGNREASAPFRESNYQPELMAVFPTNLDLLGLRMRFVNLGLLHVSNGQPSTLSRSWNRVYVQAGFERGNFMLLGRVWKRFNESANEDDNPDIVDYMGRGDLVGLYRRNGHDFSLMTRHNFQTGKSAVELSWAFPLISNLKGYVQYFSGYGYTMIDYNAYQRVLGLGIHIEFR
jgi:phospholipase A1